MRIADAAQGVRDLGASAGRIEPGKKVAMRQMEESRIRDAMHESPWTPEQRATIWRAADEILADPSFRKSRRCVVLFRRLIEHALEGGDEDGIKERTLGIEVFGREAVYDTNTDPIVRMTANEIRKRLAQYYQSCSGHLEVHIRLVPGNYLLQFDFGVRVIPPTTAPELQTEAVFSGETISEPSAPMLLAPATEPAGALEPKHRARRIAVILGLVVVATVVSALSWTYWASRSRSNQYFLWAPLLNAPEPVTICIGDVTMKDFQAEDWAQQLAGLIAGQRLAVSRGGDSQVPVVPFVDSEVSTRLGGWVNSQGKPFKVTRVSALTLEDFRHGPVVLVGAFSNSWNLILLSKLRYHFQIDPVTKEEWIEDLQNPNKRDWKGSGKLLYSDSSTDFAIITRVLDRDTGKWILAAGGLGMHGTESAGDLLTDSGLSQSLPDAVRSGKQNFQIVLKTTVIAGHTGAPQILAIHTW